MDSDPHRSQPQENGIFKSGFVAIVGAPNVGKSTLLNQLLGEKVAIVTPKPQTTRKQIRGILSGENYQIVFVDTPGIHESKRLLNKMLVKWAISALEDVDVVLFVVDVTRRRVCDELGILDLLRQVGRPVILVLNKIDRVAKESLLPIIDSLKDAYPFEAIIPISAKYSDGVDIVLDEILRLLPEGPRFYEEDVKTDQMNEELISELIREKIFLMAEEEVPYSTAVEVDRIEHDPERSRIKIFATIYVERPSQKRIIIGKDGRFIKKVGQMVREELERVFGKRVYLDLWVKVLKDWSKNEKSLKRLGLSFN
ncbi:GTP-binding protein Era [Dissulfuribacter thermophilus]|uniref:GTPase Era n=1 Tax=Dissulfuribacter thermophilus TaxID=1156395 RepID=A0A1B9F614_9BACT|nr:GTPase Era [Dissulfuribacter thermophilus]OCC15387.1 GTP-binding protein Era [Dissulfuribacter thermophilus]